MDFWGQPGRQLLLALASVWPASPPLPVVHWPGLFVNTLSRANQWDLNQDPVPHLALTASLLAAARFDDARLQKEADYLKGASASYPLSRKGIMRRLKLYMVLFVSVLMAFPIPPCAYNLRKLRLHTTLQLNKNSC